MKNKEKKRERERGENDGVTWAPQVVSGEGRSLQGLQERNLKKEGGVNLESFWSKAFQRWPPAWNR